jgi:hypothetical protein
VPSLVVEVNKHVENQTVSIENENKSKAQLRYVLLKYNMLYYATC